MLLHLGLLVVTTAVRNSSLWIHCGCIIERIRFLRDTGRPNQLKYKCLSQISTHEAQKLFSFFGEMSIEMHDWQVQAHKEDDESGHIDATLDVLAPNSVYHRITKCCLHVVPY